MECRGMGTEDKKKENNTVCIMLQSQVPTGGLWTVHGQLRETTWCNSPIFSHRTREALLSMVIRWVFPSLLKASACQKLRLRIPNGMKLWQDFASEMNDSYFSLFSVRMRA